jgi:hypothetical protein
MNEDTRTKIPVGISGDCRLDLTGGMANFLVTVRSGTQWGIPNIFVSVGSASKWNRGIFISVNISRSR